MFGVSHLAVACGLPARLFFRVFVLVVVTSVGMACAPVQNKGSGFAITPVSFEALEGWGKDELSEVIPALLKSCSKFERLPIDNTFGSQTVFLTVGDLRGPCRAAKELTNATDRETREYFEKWYVPFYVTNNGKGEGLFTGYFEVSLEGSWAPSEKYRVPIYSLPKDHVTMDLGEFDEALTGRRFVGVVDQGRLRPYPTRADIDAGRLRGLGSELVWVQDAIDVFMLHVQGSGKVYFGNGEVIRIGFAGHNGYDYSSIGKELIERGELELDQASWQGIRDWVNRNPDLSDSLMAVNKRYIFFRKIDGEGPIGAEGVVLTAGRSLAVDTRFLPLGLPFWLDTEQPSRKGVPLRRLMMAQDTGNAIRSPVRGDVFWGSGKDALASAGRMRSLGKYYLFLPRAVATRLGLV